ncbi:hypothetical protein M7963_20340 [Enterobacter roggenkampii]|uniref:hypothetical protein n=1 Tax=Enterobacter roggenkampii TaxID=1812935 RepID=UPI00223911B3|nr:hypothetical protein [Enterobacter roggenkampii]MCW5003868.1 hypothetical protein [Enterobacter roggenkampii]
MSKEINYFRDAFREILALGNKFEEFPEASLYQTSSYSDFVTLVENNKDIVKTMRAVREELLGRMHTITDEERAEFNTPLGSGEKQTPFEVVVAVTDYATNTLEEQLSTLKRWKDSL